MVEPGAGRGLTGHAPQSHLQILLLLVFEAVVYRCQDYHRRRRQLAPLPAQAVCADGTRQQLDRDLPSCLKYFVNFFFYKFGLEVRRASTLAPSLGRPEPLGVVATPCGVFCNGQAQRGGRGDHRGCQVLQLSWPCLERGLRSEGRGLGPRLERGSVSTPPWCPYLGSPHRRDVSSLSVPPGGWPGPS